jgi:protein subunit release factor B
MSKHNKKRIACVKAKDCDWQFFRGSGAGGQHRNKKDTAARCIHRASGARGEAQEYKSREQNRRAAFRRMTQHARFRCWVAEQVAAAAGQKTVAERVDEALKPQNIKIEVRGPHGWEIKKDD